MSLQTVRFDDVRLRVRFGTRDEQISTRRGRARDVLELINSADSKQNVALHGRELRKS